MPVTLEGGTGPDTLVLKISQTYYQGDAKYNVRVDGVQVGPNFTANADHASGLSDTLTLHGDWTAGQHTVTVHLYNDYWGRDLFLDGATYNGVPIAGAAQSIPKNSPPGTFTVTDVPATPSHPPVTLTAGSGPDTLVLQLSQDYYQGNAQYTVKVDGVQVGGTFTASALHSSGQSDTLTLHGDWAAGQHSVQVTFLNDGWGGSPAADRNLHLDGATYNGAAIPGVSQSLEQTNSSATFSVTDQSGPPAPPTQSPTGRFLSDASPWNTEVASNASFTEVPGLDALMNNHGVALTSWDPDYPAVGIYHATASDPVENVRWMADTWSPVNGGGVQRSGNSASVDASLMSQSSAMNTTYPMNPYSTQDADKQWNSGGAPNAAAYDEWVQTQPVSIHVPANAVPASDGDGYMVIVQPDGSALELYSAIKLGDGTLVSEMFSFTDAFGGMGVGGENGRRASMVPVYAGAITDKDLQDGSIDHALAINVPASMQATAFTGPALAFDSNPNYSGTLPMGSRLAIPESVNLSTLGLETQMGLMMAEAAQDYGVVVVDRGGGGITVATQYDPATSMLGDYSWPIQSDMEKIFHAAQLVQPDSVIWG